MVKDPLHAWKQNVKVNSTAAVLSGKATEKGLGSRELLWRNRSGIAMSSTNLLRHLSSDGSRTLASAIRSVLR